MHGWERPARARGEARGDSPIPGGDWDELGPLWGEPGESGSGLGDVPGRTLEGQTPPSNTSAAPILGDAEILAAEALLDKRLLALLLALGTGPRQAGELVRTLQVLVVKRVRVKKKVKVRDPNSWGGYREVEKEVEEDRLVPRPLPASTLYRLLARLRRAGLVEEYRGLDARRRYYRLTPLGRQVYEHARRHILAVLRKAAKEDALPWNKFEAIAQELGQPPEQLAQQLGIKAAKSYGEKHAILPPLEEQAQTRRPGSTS